MSRRGVGAGSLALLAALPPDERNTIVKDEGARVARYPRFTAVALRRWADDAARRGHAHSPERLKDIIAMLQRECAQVAKAVAVLRVA